MSSQFRSPHVCVAVAFILAAGLTGCGKEEKPAVPAPAPKPPKATPAPAPVAPAAPKAEIKAPPPVAVAPAPAPAKPVAHNGNWMLLGQQTADFRRDHDRFPVGVEKGRFREIQIRVSGAPIYLESIAVTFGNKEQFKPNVRHQFNEKSANHTIDLPGNSRLIRHIDLVYSTAARGKGKSTVRIYGR